MNFYKKCATKPYYFIIADTTFASESFSDFRENLLKRT